jgi:hypothetical protein
MYALRQVRQQQVLAWLPWPLGLTAYAARNILSSRKQRRLELIARSRRAPTSRTFSMTRPSCLARVPTVTTCIAMSEARAWGISTNAFCMSIADEVRRRDKGSTNHKIFLQACEGVDCRRPLILSVKDHVSQRDREKHGPFECVKCRGDADSCHLGG